MFKKNATSTVEELETTPKPGRAKRAAKRSLKVAAYATALGIAGVFGLHKLEKAANQN